MADDLGPAERRALRQKVRSATLAALRAHGGEARRQAIEEHALAHGGFTSAELAVPAPENAREGVERLVDHLLRWELTNLKRDGLVVNPARGRWRMAEAAVEAQPERLAEDMPLDRVAELEAMPYREYLRSPEWRRTRAAAILRAGNRCALNAAHDGPLHVHHNSYDERRGQERSIDLTVLCEACHALHHRKDGRPGRRARPGAAKSASSTLGRTESVPPPRAPSSPPAKQPSLLRRLLGAA